MCLHCVALSFFFASPHSTLQHFSRKSPEVVTACEMRVHIIITCGNIIYENENNQIPDTIILVYGIT